jgi:hypothetical protein
LVIDPRAAFTRALFRTGLVTVTPRRSQTFRADLDMAAVLDLVFAPVYYRLLFSHEPLDEAFAERCIDHVLTGIASPGNT